MKFLHRNRSLLWLLWGGWTLLLCFLMLSPSDGTVEDISGIFGGTEITDALGHVILICIESLLLYHVVLHYQPPSKASQIALPLALIFGLALETGQLFIPSRGASLIDMGAAFIGVGLAYAIIRWKFARLRPDAVL